MHIGIYTLFLTPGRIGGIETYLRHLVAALGRVDQTNHYTLFVGEHNRTLFEDKNYPNFEKVNISLNPPSPSLASHILSKLKIIPTYIARQLYLHPVDLLHYPGTTIDQPQIKTPCVLTMHDIQQEYLPEFFSREVLAWRKATFASSARKARHIITVSDYTRQTIIEKYQVSPQKVTAIHSGVGEAFRSPAPPEVVQRVRRRYRLPERFLCFPANPWPHKNHRRLFEAIERLKQRYGVSCPLILTGLFGPEQANLQTMITQTGIAKDVHILGYIPYEDLPAIYTAATALVFPSLFEGFGLPVLEAMGCGCPVICANTTSLPELVGEAAMLVDPLDITHLAEAIYKVWTTESLRSSLHQKGREQIKNFSWERTARETIEVYQKALSGSRKIGGI